MSSEQISIGMFSQITRLTQKALRLYDKKGLLRPAMKDEFTGYRYYSVGQIETGIKIKFLVTLGFSLEEVGELLKASESGNHEVINTRFSRRLSEVRQDIGKLEKIESILLGKIPIEGLFMSSIEPAVKEISALRVVSKKDVATLENIGMTVGKLIGEIMGQIFSPKNQGQVAISGPPMCLYLDETYKEAGINMEIAVPIKGKIAVDPDFEVRNLPAGKVIYVVHKGPYVTISEEYTKIFEYSTKKGYKQAGPIREIYLTNPNERTPEENMTELQLPVE